MKRGPNRAGRRIALGFLAVWLIGIAVYVLLERNVRMGRRLFKAAEVGDVAGVERLLKAGAFMNMRNRDGYTALWLAASNGNTKVAETLLKHGADPNHRSADGTTPLMEASRMGGAEVVSALLAYRANVNAEGNNGETALMFAVQEKHERVAALLRKAGAAQGQAGLH